LFCCIMSVRPANMPWQFLIVFVNKYEDYSWITMISHDHPDMCQRHSANTAAGQGGVTSPFRGDFGGSLEGFSFLESQIVPSIFQIFLILPQ
ncbi:hypothetical protein GOODEAATRI_010394, partial [Goodea atripinnis]